MTEFLLERHLALRCFFATASIISLAAAARDTGWYTPFSPILNAAM